jgi:hypothetical protein
MRQYGIRREGELLSGYILRFMNKQYAKQAKAFEIRNEIAHAVRAVREKSVIFVYTSVVSWTRLFIIGIFVTFGKNSINQHRKMKSHHYNYGKRSVES